MHLLISILVLTITAIPFGIFALKKRREKRLSTTSKTSFFDTEDEEDFHLWI
jgi:hypothetical protein